MRITILSMLLALPACDVQQAEPRANLAADQSKSLPQPAPAAAAKPPVQKSAAAGITPSGYDTIRIGAPPSAATGYALADDGSFTEDCRIYSSDKLPGAYAIVERGIVRRLSFGQRAARTLRTDRGIAVGDSIEDVRRAYPRIEEEPHHYVTPGGRYLTMGGEARTPGIRFETGNEGRVTIIHVGEAPVLSYVEGCA